MYEYNDPSGRGRAAIIAVLAWLVADFVYSVGVVVTLASLGMLGPSIVVRDPDFVDLFVGVSSIAMLLALIVSVVFVSRWIMRVNANAHYLSPESMTITPGWNIGWFFIPVATLWKPFQGLRETWQASASPNHPAAISVPAVMRWWWGLWLVSNILGNVSARLSFGEPTADTMGVACWIDLATFVVDVPLTYAVIVMITQFNRVQTQGLDYAETFA